MNEYNVDYVCTYTTVEEYKDLVQDLGKEFVEDLLYKNDMLKIFNLKEYDDEIILNILDNVYNKIKTNESITKSIKYIKETNPYFIQDDMTAFMLLFSFDYLHISHLCICDLIKTGTVTEENLTKLNKLFML